MLVVPSRTGKYCPDNPGLVRTKDPVPYQCEEVFLVRPANASYLVGYPCDEERQLVLPSPFAPQMLQLRNLKNLLFRFESPDPEYMIPVYKDTQDGSQVFYPPEAANDLADWGLAAGFVLPGSHISCWISYVMGNNNLPFAVARPSRRWLENCRLPASFLLSRGKLANGERLGECRVVVVRVPRQGERYMLDISFAPYETAIPIRVCPKASDEKHRLLGGRVYEGKLFRRGCECRLKVLHCIEYGQ